MAEQSTGLRLDEHFDLVFDSSGDVESVANIEELKKDISVIVWTVVNNQLIGNVLTANIVLTLESQIRSRIGNDDRIVEVTDVTVNRQRGRSAVSVSVSANSTYGPIQFTN